MDAVQSLVRAAIHASKNAYIPYSHYPVGAALLTSGGQVFTGCNIENASYPAGICAERTALFKAVSEGYKTFDTMALVTQTGGSPCGICRQALYEFAPDLTIIIADMDGKVHHQKPLRALLPLGFGGDNLTG
jgi:cytidine deaminase